MKRIDYDILLDWVKGGSLKQSQAKHMAFLPFIKVPFPKVVITDNGPIPTADDEWTKYYCAHDIVAGFLKEDFFFEEFVSYYELAGSEINYKVIIYTHFKFIDDTTMEVLANIQPISKQDPLELPMVIKGIIRIGQGDDGKGMSLQTFGIKDITGQRLYVDQAESLLNYIQSAFYTVHNFMCFNNEHDRYVTSVTPQRPPVVKRKLPFHLTLKNCMGPRIIFLDSLPTPHNGFKTYETDSLKSPHHRRGYYKTLRSERYRYHPKFQVENAIYVKPTFVGDRTALVNGNIYTILDKQ